MKICAAQTKPIKGDIPKNIENHKKLIEMYPLHQPLVFLQIIRVHLWRYGFKNNGTDNAGSYCIV